MEAFNGCHDAGSDDDKWDEWSACYVVVPKVRGIESLSRVSKVRLGMRDEQWEPNTVSGIESKQSRAC